MIDRRLDPLLVGGESDHRRPLNIERQQLTADHRVLKVDHQVASALVSEAVADSAGRVPIVDELHAVAPEMVEDRRDTALKKLDLLHAVERRPTPLRVIEDKRGSVVEDLVGAADRALGQ